MPADEPQAVEAVEWQLRLISPIVLEDTLLSSKLRSPSGRSRPESWPRTRPSLLTAIGATFFSIRGNEDSGPACAVIVTLLNAAPKIFAR